MDPTLTNRYQWPSSSMGMAIAAAGPRARGSVSRRNWHCPSFGRWGRGSQGWLETASGFLDAVVLVRSQRTSSAEGSCIMLRDGYLACTSLHCHRGPDIRPPSPAQALRSLTVASDMLKIRRRKHVAPVAMAREPPPCAKLRLPRRRHQICVSFATTAIADSAAPMSRK